MKALICTLALLWPLAGAAQTNAAIDCYLGGIRPNESLHETVITFVNNSDTEVDILWVDYDGVEVYYNTLQPGGSYDQPSFYGHPWVVYRSESNICKGIVVPFAPRVRLELN